ncbi:MAG TPA: HNH endonuclease [Terrisporobacter glycolicus]|uniref:HNH endonuclease n=1 Tax=Terrisporobacter TaxID=1505652 RepID=UPI000E958A85|nr:MULTISPECIES: HNH endonuclease [Terrisporobacter]HBI91192.1 HNH endonuclease [Terrisporobacter hibernicus]
MAREFAKHIYKSSKWKKVRQYIFNKYHGTCCKCGGVKNLQVHHKIWLTPKNINDMDIVYGEDNLMLLCHDCHALEHLKASPTKEGLKFNEYGELIKINSE